MAVLNLDLAGYDPEGSDPTPIPPGDYEVLIVGSRLKQSLTLAGLAPEAETCPGVDPAGSPSPRRLKVAEFEFLVLGPVCRGAKLRDSFTLSEDASMCRMKTLAVAARCPNPDFIGDTEELHGLRCRVRVERTGGFRSPGRKNVISGYMRSGVQFPVRGTFSGAAPFARLSFGGRSIAERIEAVGPESCGRSYPWKE